MLFPPNSQYSIRQWLLDGSSKRQTQIDTSRVLAKMLGHYDILNSGLSRLSAGIYYRIRRLDPDRPLLGLCKWSNTMFV